MKFIGFLLFIAGFGIVVFDFLLMADGQKPAFFFAAFMAVEELESVGVMVALVTWVAPLIVGATSVLSYKAK